MANSWCSRSAQPSLGVEPDADLRAFSRPVNLLLAHGSFDSTWSWATSGVLRERPALGAELRWTVVQTQPVAAARRAMVAAFARNAPRRSCSDGADRQSSTGAGRGVRNLFQSHPRLRRATRNQTPRALELINLDWS